MTAPLAMTGQFFHSSTKVKGNGWPDIQAFFVPVSPSKLLVEIFGRAFSIKEEVFAEMIDPHHGKDGFVLLTTLVRPKSRGELTLKDKNPFSDPLIGIKHSIINYFSLHWTVIEFEFELILDPRPFSHPEDMETLIQGKDILRPRIRDTEIIIN